MGKKKDENITNSSYTYNKYLFFYAQICNNNLQNNHVLFYL